MEKQTEDKLPKKDKIKHGLGKGLGALIPSVEFNKEKGFKVSPVSSSEGEKKGTVTLIDIDKIKRNPYQPRRDFDPEALEELKNSILKHGVIQAIAVRHSINGYELISGERRLRASIAAGLKKIPAYVLEDVSDKQMLELALIENVQRENLNPIEIAHGYNRLIEECNYTQEQVAERVGKDRTTVTNFLRLLKLPESIQELVREKKLSMGHARTLLALDDPAKIIAASHEILEKELSVRATENLVRDIQKGKVKFTYDGKRIAPQKEKQEVLPKESALQLEEIENRLRHLFATNVKIIPKNQESGTIEFEFYSIDDFERLIEIFEKVNQKDNNG